MSGFWCTHYLCVLYVHVGVISLVVVLNTCTRNRYVYCMKCWYWECNPSHLYSCSLHHFLDNASAQYVYCSSRGFPIITALLLLIQTYAVQRYLFYLWVGHVIILLKYRFMPITNTVEICEIYFTLPNYPTTTSSTKLSNLTARIHSYVFAQTIPNCLHSYKEGTTSN